jgi:hypothetical protein
MEHCDGARICKLYNCILIYTCRLFWLIPEGVDKHLRHLLKSYQNPFTYTLLSQSITFNTPPEISFRIRCKLNDGFNLRLSINRPTKRGKENSPSDGHCQCEKEMDDHLLAC